MAALTGMVSLAKKVGNNYAAVGNMVQLGDGDSVPMGTAENPIVVVGPGGSGEGEVILVDAGGNPVGTNTNPLYATVAVDATTINFTPTLDITPDYQAGDVISTIASAPIVLQAGDSGKLKSVHIRDKSGQAPALLIYFFSDSPTGGTYTNNAALVWGTGDASKCQGVISVAAANYITLAGVSMQTLSNIDQIHTPSTTSIYLLLIANGPYNAAGAEDLIIALSWERME